MTQIIGVVTQQYALMASDRRLTIGEGPKRGELVDDDTCKLVNLCNVCAIAYTGLARIEGSPTHEWIAKTLAAANCADTGAASEVLASHATEAFAKIRPSLRQQSFLLTGWASFDGMSGLRPHLGIITNYIDEQGRHIAQAKAKFDRRFRALLDGEEFVWTAVGEPLRADRQQQFARNLRKMIAKKMGPQVISDN
jgi:hypothetical protein